MLSFLSLMTVMAQGLAVCNTYRAGMVMAIQTLLAIASRLLFIELSAIRKTRLPNNRFATVDANVAITFKDLFANMAHSQFMFELSKDGV